MGKLNNYILKTIILSLIYPVCNVSLAEQDIAGTVQRQQEPVNNKPDEKDFALEATIALFKRQACLDFMNFITESQKYKFAWANPDKKLIGLFQDSVQGIVGCGQISLPIDQNKTEPHPEFSNIIYNESNKEPGIINYLSQRLTKNIGNIYGTTYINEFTALFAVCNLYKEKIINNKRIKNKELQSFGDYFPDFPLVIFPDSFEIEAFNNKVERIEKTFRQTGCVNAKDKKDWMQILGAAGLSPINVGGGSGGGGSGGGGGAGGAGTGVAMISTIDQLSPEERLKQQIAKKNEITFGPGGVAGLPGSTPDGSARPGTKCAEDDPYCTNPIDCTADDPDCNVSCTKDDPDYPECCPKDDPECGEVLQTCPPGEVCTPGGGSLLQECLITNLVENCIPPAFNTNVYTFFTNINKYAPQNGVIFNYPNPGGESGAGFSLSCVNSALNPGGCTLLSQSWNNYRTYRSTILNSSLGDQATRPEQLWLN